jgi:hypothetical protein
MLPGASALTTVRSQSRYLAIQLRCRLAFVSIVGKKAASATRDISTCNESTALKGARCVVNIPLWHLNYPFYSRG